MKKPKTIELRANHYESTRLSCNYGQKIVVLAKSEFDAIWKLAKEAMHANAASAIPESVEDRCLEE